MRIAAEGKAKASSAVALYVAVASVIAICGLSFAGVAILPSRILTETAAAAAPDGEIKFLTSGVIRGIRIALLLGAGAAFAALAFLLTRGSSLALDVLGAFAADALRFGRALRQDIAETARPVRRELQIALVITFLAALGIRLWYVAQPIRHDEARTYLSFVSKSPLDFLSNYWAPNNHIFHTILAYISISVFGNSPVTLRIPALLAGIFVVPLVYFAACRLLDRNSAMVAAGLAAIWPPLIEYSVNARGYSLVAMFGLVILILATYLIEDNSLTAWLLFVAACVLGLYTIPVMLYLIGWIGIWTLLAAMPGHRLATYRSLSFAGVGVILCTCLLYLPPAWRSGLDAIIAGPAVAPVSEEKIGRVADSLTWRTWDWWTADIPLVMLVPLIIAVLVMLVPLGQQSRRAAMFFWAGILWIGGFTMVTRAIPQERTTVIILPFILILAGGGVVKLLSTVTMPPRRVAWITSASALVVVAYMGGFLLVKRSEVSSIFDRFSSARELVTFLQPRLQPGDMLVYRFPATGPIEYYSEQIGLPKSYLQGHTLDPEYKRVLGARRIFLVEQYEMHPLKDFDTADVHLSNSFGPPEVVREYPDARLLVMKRELPQDRRDPSVLESVESRSGSS